MQKQSLSKPEKRETVKVPAGLKPAVSFKIVAYKQYWFRVHVHRGLHQMRAYMVYVLTASSGLEGHGRWDAFADTMGGCCSCPPFRDSDPNCIGEINLNGPWLESVAHEIQHAVQATLAVIRKPAGIPTKRDATMPRSQRAVNRKVLRRDEKRRGDPEIAANMAGRMLSQCLRYFVKHGMLEFNQKWE